MLLGVSTMRPEFVLVQVGMFRTLQMSPLLPGRGLACSSVVFNTIGRNARCCGEQRCGLSSEREPFLAPPRLAKTRQPGAQCGI